MSPESPTTGAPKLEDARIAIVVPTFKRPQKLAALVENLRAATQAPCKLFFVVEHHDQPTIDEASELRVDMIYNEGPGTYASCINTAYRRTTAEFLFLGADDIRFGERCFEIALEAADESGAGIVGAFDPLHADKDDHADHYMVRRQYIERYGGAWGERGTVLHNYRHGFTDIEAIQLAKVRNSYCFRHDFVIYHDHPGWTISGAVDETGDAFDETYQKGNASVDDDFRVYVRRSRRWRRQLLSKNPTRFDKHLVRLARENDPLIKNMYSSAMRVRRHIPESVRQLVRNARSRLRPPSADREEDRL